MYVSSKRWHISLGSSNLPCELVLRSLRSTLMGCYVAIFSRGLRPRTPASLWRLVAPWSFAASAAVDSVSPCSRRLLSQGVLLAPALRRGRRCAASDFMGAWQLHSRIGSGPPSETGAGAASGIRSVRIRCTHGYVTCSAADSYPLEKPRHRVAKTTPARAAVSQ